MKKALSFLIIILSYVSVFGQITNNNERIIRVKILTADTLVRGIYLDFSEFQQNYPSIRSDIRSNEEELPVNSIYDDMDIKRLRILDSDNTFIPFKQKHWGICDGKNVFINYKGNYKKISIDGKYSSFTEAASSYYGHVNSVDFLLNVVSGAIIRVKENAIQSILLQEHVFLYHDFRDERDKEMMIYTYISWLNKSYEYE